MKREKCLLSGVFALGLVKKALPRANKKSIMLIDFIRLHPEKGGFCAECDLNHGVDAGGPMPGCSGLLGS
jgi:hypothetical protein